MKNATKHQWFYPNGTSAYAICDLCSARRWKTTGPRGGLVTLYRRQGDPGPKQRECPPCERVKPAAVTS